MYQNRLGPSGGIYYLNFAPCFVVLYLNGSTSQMKYNLGQTDDIGLESPRSMSTASKVNKQITNKPIAPFMSAFFRKTIYNPLHSVIECQLKITTQEGK